MAKIYWFTGQPGHGKTVLAKKLVEFLQTEKRNWRKQVFHLDEEEIKQITEIQNSTEITQTIVEFLYKNDSDVVVSHTSPNREIRDFFKEKIGEEDFEEFYVHTTQKRDKEKSKIKEYEPPQSKYFDIDTTKDNPIQSFNKIVHYLIENNSI